MVNYRQHQELQLQEGRCPSSVTHRTRSVLEFFVQFHLPFEGKWDATTGLNLEWSWGLDIGICSTFLVWQFCSDRSTTWNGHCRLDLITTQSPTAKPRKIGSAARKCPAYSNIRQRLHSKAKPEGTQVSGFYLKTPNLKSHAPIVSILTHLFHFHFTFTT